MTVTRTSRLSVALLATLALGILAVVGFAIYNNAQTAKRVDQQYARALQAVDALGAQVRSDGGVPVIESDDLPEPEANVGPRGDQGDDGSDGIPGSDGLPGNDGTDGSDGTDGAPGTNGLRGPRGLPGEDGAPGSPGADGAPGADGQDGATGPTGATGEQGPKGDTGQTGATGADGSTGPQGAAVESFTFTQLGITYTCADENQDGAYTCEAT